MQPINTQDPSDIERLREEDKYRPSGQEAKRMNPELPAHFEDRNQFASASHGPSGIATCLLKVPNVFLINLTYICFMIALLVLVYQAAWPPSPGEARDTSAAPSNAQQGPPTDYFSRGNRAWLATIGLAVALLSNIILKSNTYYKAHHQYLNAARHNYEACRKYEAGSELRVIIFPIASMTVFSILAAILSWDNYHQPIFYFLASGYTGLITAVFINGGPREIDEEY